MTTTFVRAVCPHDCPDACEMVVTVEDGRAVKVHGDPEHPTTHGALCTRVSRYPERTCLARGIVTGQGVGIFNDRGAIECKARVGPRARPGVVNGLGIWWKKLAADRCNVNELTHRQLTDIGRGPSFYDCLVEVEPAAVHRSR